MDRMGRLTQTGWFYGGCLALAIAAWPVGAQATRIKEIASVQGVRPNQLVGYGLVVGLDGTGDQTTSAPFTTQSINSLLQQMGVTVPAGVSMQLKNVAAVMVTARLPAFSASGSQIDATVSALGDSKSLLGGTLLVTPLLGADGEAYAVAQGTVQTGSVSASGGSGSSVTKGVPTAGRIAAGAVVEREIGFQLASMTKMRMTLRNPDFTTSGRIADAVNTRFPGTARADNPTIVTLQPPAGEDMMRFVAQMGHMRHHFGIDAVQETQTFAANGHGQRRLAFSLRFTQFTCHSAQQVGVQATAQTLVRGHHNEADGLAVVLLHEGVHVLRVGLPEMGRNGANLLAVRPGRAHTLLRLAHFGDGNHLHGLGDLLGVFHRFDLGA